MPASLLRPAIATPRGVRASVLAVVLAAVAAAAAAAQGPAGRDSSARNVAAPPKAPRSYKLPRNAIWVSTSAGLRRALARNRSRDIVLRAGVYDAPEPFYNPHGNRLYAERLGQVLLRAGLSIGANSGGARGSVRGVSFDVDDESKTLEHSIIHTWGTGTDAQVLDVTLEGHGVVSAGIYARQVEGLVVRRVIARHFRNYGLLVDANVRDHQVARPPLLEDIVASNVSRSPPRSSNGQAEACIWIGNTAIVRRVRVHDCAWEGIWLGTAVRNGLLEDVRITRTGIGAYLEHFVRSTTFRRLQIGPDVKRGVTCEWADPSWGRQPACTSVVVEQSSFDTQTVGVYLDEGTASTTIRSSTFANQCWAAIGDYKGIGNLFDTAGNDYSRLRPGAVPISYGHYTSAAACADLAGG